MRILSANSTSSEVGFYGDRSSRTLEREFRMVGPSTILLGWIQWHHPSYCTEEYVRDVCSPFRLTKQKQCLMDFVAFRLMIPSVLSGYHGSRFPLAWHRPVRLLSHSDDATCSEIIQLSWLRQDNVWIPSAQLFLLISFFAMLEKSLSTILLSNNF